MSVTSASGLGTCRMAFGWTFGPRCPAVWCPAATVADGTWPLTARRFSSSRRMQRSPMHRSSRSVGVAMLVGFAYFGVSSVPLLGALVANVERSLLGWIVGVVRFGSGLPHAHVF